MAAAVENLSLMKGERKVAILGDMYELGEEAEAEHEILGTILGERKIKEVYLCGVLIKAAMETYPSARYFATKEELIQFLHQHPIENATVLVKASRGMRLEQIVEAL
jgi:UDP-N-acetylmuramoyl-tripeptide--D-alanyl-D-alanine ligase